PTFLDDFLELYRAWLRARGLAHSRAVFRRWARRDYCPGDCRGRVELLDEPRAWVGEPFALRVRVHNTGVQTWRFRPGTNAGIHLGYILWDPHDHWHGT